jgi:hypothetical protein
MTRTKHCLLASTVIPALALVQTTQVAAADRGVMVIAPRKQSHRRG